MMRRIRPQPGGAARGKTNTVDDPVPARILWPALGFPAVISSASPSWASMESRQLILLVVTGEKYLSKADIARKLRYVPWADRHTRYVDAVPGTNAFDEVDIVKHAKIEPFAADSLTQLLLLGYPVKEHDGPGGQGGMVIGLSNFVRKFYTDNKMPYLYEIRISESASAAIAPSPHPYNLIWTNRAHVTGPNPDVRSDEMHLLLEKYATSSRFGHDGIPTLERLKAAGNRPISFSHPGAVPSLLPLIAPQSRDATIKKIQQEYEYEFRQPADPAHRVEVLHPLFVIAAPAKLRIGHVTDPHYDVRTDAYEAALLKQGVKKFHNWNNASDKVYAAVAAESDALLLTGDLIDYGRGYNDRGPIGKDESYWRDRNWFLFYEKIAGGQKYTKPVYTNLGNHDWRINPYPPFTFGSPDRDSMGMDKDPKALQKAHGEGYDAIMYSMDLGTVGGYFWDKLIRRDGDLTMGGSPVEKVVESVAWYLLVMNPFFDYSFTFPGGYQMLMLDWAVGEEVDHAEVAGGIDYGKTLLVANSAGGPTANNCLTKQQRVLVEHAAESQSMARILGIHAPPVGPWPHWTDDNLVNGIVKWEPAKPVRGATVRVEPTYDAKQKPIRTRRIYEHPARPFRLSKDNPAGQDGDYGSHRDREWLVKTLRDNKFQLVFSGHIHRNNLMVVFVHPTSENKPNVPAKDQRISDYAAELMVKTVPTDKAKGEPKPWFVNTTSAGPLGNRYLARGVYEAAPSGYAVASISKDGQDVTVEYKKV